MPTIDPTKIKEDTSINQADLSSEMIRQPGLYAYYASVAAEMEKKHQKAKVNLEIIEATVDKALRAKFVAEGVKVTEPQVAKEIRLNKRYLDAQTALAEAKFESDMAKGLLLAIASKKDMLIQLATNGREEMKMRVRVSGSHHTA